MAAFFITRGPDSHRLATHSAAGGLRAYGGYGVVGRVARQRVMSAGAALECGNAAGDIIGLHTLAGSGGVLQHLLGL